MEEEGQEGGNEGCHRCGSRPASTAPSENDDFIIIFLDISFYFLYQSSIGTPMPGTGRGRYEPLSRLNLVERLLLLELLLLLLLLLVKTPLV